MSAAPPRHLKIWAVGPDLFVEIPGRLGPYITSYSCDSRGITLLLDLLGRKRTDTDFAIPPNQASPYRTAHYDKGPGSPEQQASADLALKRAGILK